MPETVFKPEKIRDAIHLTEETLERKVRQVDGSGLHRVIRWKNREGNTRIVFSKEPLNDYGGTLGIPSYHGETGVSLQVEKFQDSLQTEKIDEVIHVTGNADLYISTPVDWREFLNESEFNPVWTIESTGEKVISIPASQLNKV